MKRLILATVLAALAAAPALADGRGLFQGYDVFAAGDRATNSGRPAALAACSNCHGPTAGGTREGHGGVPSARWSDLMSASDDGPAYRSPDDVLQAITAGIGRAGRPLNPLMPRFALTAEEGRALLSYLEIAGTVSDVPQGVSGNTVTFGTLVPLSGPLEQTGKQIVAGLSTAIENANRRGGINGRHIRLASADSAKGGLDAARSLARTPVYAVIGSLWPPADGGIEAFFAQHRIAMIAGLTPRQKAPAASGWSVDLLPPVDVQDEALLSAMLACETSGERLMLATSSHPQPEGVRQLAGVQAMRQALGTAPQPGCAGLEVSSLEAVATAMPAGWQQRIVLPFPAGLAMQQESGVWQTLGYAAGQTALEFLAASGAALHEHALLDQAAGLSGFEPLAGLPLQFSDHRRYGWDPAVLLLDAGQRTSSEPHLTATKE